MLIAPYLLNPYLLKMKAADRQMHPPTGFIS